MKNNGINFIYKLVFNKKTGMYVPVAETSSNVGGKRKLKALAIASMFCATTLLAEPSATALPQGGSVVHGNAAISQNNATLNINQSTNKSIINWNSFNIGRDATVNFNMPSSSSSSLNRIGSNSSSQIYGKLNSNGKVFLVNSSGVYFAPGSKVNVGALVASTLNITDNNFINENLSFFKDGDTQGKIYNLGDVFADDQSYIAFIAPTVKNEGSTTAKDGSVALLAAEQVKISFDTNGLINFKIESNAIDALIENKGLVKVNEGIAILSAKAVDTINDSVINVNGEIEANSLVAKGGRILLEADNITLEATSNLDASGKTGGGLVQVGGSWQNKDTTIAQAVKTIQKKGSVIDASATDNGDGGEVVVWSDVTNDDSETYAEGIIKAKGGANGGDGGKVETSGGFLEVNALDLDIYSEHGKGGLWLIDPYDITIDNGGTVTSSTQMLPFYQSQKTNSRIDKDSIEWHLNRGATVYIDTGGGSSASGSIFLISGIYKTAGGNALLRLRAHNNIYIRQPIKSTSNKLNIELVGDRDQNGKGGVYFQHSSADIDTNGGSFSLAGGDGYRASYSRGVANTPRTVGSRWESGSSLITKGGDIYMAGQGGGLGHGLFFRNTTIDAGSGDIELIGVGSGGRSGIMIYDQTTIKGKNITLTGTGSSTATTTDTQANGGVSFGWDGSAITVEATDGNINITGTSNTKNTAFTDTHQDAGVGFNNDDLILRTVNSGDIIINGTSSTDEGAGVFFEKTPATFEAAGNITITGSNDNDLDIKFKDGTSPAFESTGGGDITLVANTGLFTADLANYDTTGGVIFKQRTDPTKLHIGSTNENRIDLDIFSKVSNAAYVELSYKTNTGGIELHDDLSHARNLHLYNQGDISLNGALTNTNLTKLYSEGSVTQSDTFTSPTATFEGSGTFTLTNLLNDFDSIAGSTLGNLNLIDKDDLTITSVDSIDGLDGTGTFSVATLSNDLTISQNINTTDTTSSAITLNAGRNESAGTSTGGDIVLSGGDITVGAGGIAALYTGSVSGSTAMASNIGSGTGRFRYNSDETTTNYTKALEAGKNLIYREAISLTGSDVTKTYDGVAFSGGGTVTGFVNGDTAALSHTYTGNSQGAKNVGTYTISMGTNYLGYNTLANHTLTINKANLTIDANDRSKTYGDNLSLGTSAFTTTGLQNSETVGSVTLTSGSGNDTDTTANAGTYSDDITPSAAIGGTFDINNYNVTYTDGDLTIDKKSLTVTASDDSKTYDGLGYSGGNGVVYSGFVNGENSSIIGGTLSYTGTSQDAKNIGTYVLTPQGLSSGNYSFNYVNGDLTIGKANLTVNANDRTKTYGDNLSLGTSAFTATGLQNSETIGSVTLTSSSGNDTDTTANAGTYSDDITVNNATGGTFDINNYNVTYNTILGDLTVNKAPLRIKAKDMSTEYTGVRHSGWNGVTYDGFVNGESESVLDGTLNYSGNTQGAIRPGKYSFIPFGYTADNYNITFVNGLLNILKSDLYYERIAMKEALTTGKVKVKLQNNVVEQRNENIIVNFSTPEVKPVIAATGNGIEVHSINKASPIQSVSFNNNKTVSKYTSIHADNNLPKTGVNNIIQVIIDKTGSIPYIDKSIKVKQTTNQFEIEQAPIKQEKFSIPGEIEKSIIVKLTNEQGESFIVNLTQAGVVVKPLNDNSVQIIETKKDIVISSVLAELYNQLNINASQVKSIYFKV